MRSRPCPLRPLVGPVLLAVLAAALLPRPARAAASVEGEAPVHEVHLDPGTLGEGAPTTVRVAKGDTLSELAKRHLGSAKRTAEIQRLNPGTDARSLRVGQVLKLPPRRTAASEGWLEFFVALPGGKAHPIARGQPVELPLGPVRVFAASTERVQRLRSLAGKRGLTETLLFGDREVARSGLFDVTAPDDRALARAVTRLVVNGRQGSTLEVQVAEQRLFSAGGHRLAGPDDGAEGGSALAPLLLALGGLALVGVLAWGARRRLRAPRAAAPLRLAAADADADAGGDPFDGAPPRG